MSEIRAIDANALKEEVNELAIPIWAISQVQHLIDQVPTVESQINTKEVPVDVIHVDEDRLKRIITEAVYRALAEGAKYEAECMARGLECAE